MTGGLGEELSELGLRHFASTHGEFPVPNASHPANVAVNGDVVRRVREQQIGLLIDEQGGEVLMRAGIATDYLVAAELPDVTALRNLDAREGRDEILISDFGDGRPLTRRGNHQVGFHDRKPGDGNIKIQFAERLQLDGKDLLIPASVRSELVVSKNVGPSRR